MTKIIRCYSDLKRLITFEDRYDYLRLKGNVGKPSFGFDRYLNQMLYKSGRWRSIRDKVIIRDDGNDLGVEGYKVNDQIVIHHMNPISPEDIENEDDQIFNIEYLICVSPRTHLAIHYSNESLIPKPPVVRRPGDTIPWR